MQRWSPTKRQFIPHFARPFYKRFGNRPKSSKQRSPSRQLQLKFADDIALISSSENDIIEYQKIATINSQKSL